MPRARSCLRALFVPVVLLALLACGSDEPAAPPQEPTPQPDLPGEWKPSAPMPGVRSELGAGVIDGKIYVVGGRLDNDKALPTLEVYDPATDSWAAAPPLPVALDHAGVAAVNGKLYVLGGYAAIAHAFDKTVVATVYEFDPAISTWSTRKPMPSPRTAFAVAVLGNKIHCIGGLTGKAHTAYDVVTDTWETLPEMPTPREHVGAATIGTTIYVVGGRYAGDPSSPGTQNTNAAEAYDTETKTWTELPNMPSYRGGLGVAAVGGKVYAFGGEFPGVYKNVEEFDPTTKTWRTMQPMPTPRHGISTAVLNGWIHVVGGGTKPGAGSSAAHEAFRPE